MKLKNKLIIFMLISTIPIIILTFYAYNRYTKLVMEQTSQVADNIFENALLASNATISEIRHISEIFNFYSESKDSIIDDLKKYTHTGYTYYDIWESNRNISYICQNLIFSFDYINGIFIFTPTDSVLGYGFKNSIAIDNSYRPYGDAWYQKTLERQGQYYIDGPAEKHFILNAKEPSISFSQALYDVYTHEFLGVLYIDCNQKLFNLSGVNTLPDMAMLSVELDLGHILYSNIYDLNTDFRSSNTLVRTRDLDIEGLRLLFSVNYDDLTRKFGATRSMILIISALCTVVLLVTSFLMSAHVTRPILYLNRKMTIRQGEHLEISSKYLNRTDEIGSLFHEYNRMVNTLEFYIKNELQYKLITLDSQMKSLEAQINSHFLYNTLESINSIAALEEVESIATMSLALGNMFRYSIKTQSELVTVADELKHVNDYVAIQQIQFDQRFQLILKIPEEHLHLKVLKLILQPIVENALFHGLQYCICGSTITMESRLQELCLYISISDDGIGMKPEQLREIQEKLKEKAEFTELGQRNKQSIGLKNIHTRISLYYGYGYGLTIQSLEGKGTTITVKLPVPEV